MKKLVMLAAVTALVIAAATPAFAAGPDATGREFGLHHAEHAQQMTGFTGTMNPGVMHEGFSGWRGM